MLITGETGTGKEVAARYLHDVSGRKGHPFVAVNCGAIPHDLLESQFFGHERGAFTGAGQAHVGFFEEAGDGTLFLDEIGELDARLQTALLRVLEDRTFRPLGARKDRVFEGRIIAATNAELSSMREGKRFRDDLYYRLAVIDITLPPLRDRRSEIPVLAEKFLGEASAKHGRPSPNLDAEADAALLAHPWPGNIRELRNRIERAVVLCRSENIGHQDLFPELRLADMPLASLAETRRQAEAAEIEQALERAGGRVAEAARSLGISRTTLWNKRTRSKE